MRFKRSARVSNEIRRALSEILQKGLSDPRITPFVVTEVIVTDDLRLARVRYLPMGQTDDLERLKEGLKAAQGFISREVARRVRLRYTPSIQFFHDDSLDAASQVIEALSKQEDDFENDASQGEDED